METTLFLALAVMALVFFDRHREVALGVCLVLLVLVRGDGILLATALLGLTWVRARALPWRMLLAATLAALPWAVYAVLVLGSVLPDTLAAKVAQSKSGFWGHGELLVSRVGDEAHRWGYSTWLWVVTPLAAVGLARAMLEERFRAATLAFVGAATVQLFVYSVVLRVPNYSWYYVWGLAAMSVLAGLGASWILEQSIGRVRVAAGVVTATIVVTLFAVVAREPVQHLSNYQPYLTAARWVRTNTPPGATVASTEIGVIGWNDARPTVDYVGLLDVTSISELRRGDLTSWLARSQPDFWITHDPMWGFEVPAAQTALFAQRYRRVFADQGLAIFQRHD